MLKRLLISGLLCISFVLFTEAQTHLDQFYRSTLQPKELSLTAIERIDSLYVHLGSQERDRLGYSNRQYRDFLFQTNYFFEQLNKSGKVFFGDTISQYLNQLKDRLLEGDPLQSKVTIYLTQNPHINAFTNDFGAIYVNIGLVAKLKSEAELLSVIAHEIAHIQNRHTHEYEAFSNQKRWNKEGIEKVLAKHQFNQQQEFEADQGAILLLDKLGIPLSATLNALELLQNSANPIFFGKPSPQLLAANEPFAKEYWRTVYAQSDSLFVGLESLPEISDSLQTHPSIERRLDSVRVHINNLPSKESSFKSAADYSFFRATALQLLLQSYLHKGWLEEGLQLTLQLRSKQPNDTTLIKTQAKFLTLMTQDKYNASSFDQVLNFGVQNISDSGYLHFKEAYASLNATETNLLALLAINELRKDYPIDYLDRTHKYLSLFFYKNHPNVFAVYGDRIGFLPSSKITENNFNVNLLDPFFSLSNKQKLGYHILTQHKQDLVVQVRGKSKTLPLLQYYTQQFPWEEVQQQYVEEFKEQRRRYEATLTIDQFQPIIDSKYAFFKYREGVQHSSENYSLKDSIAICGLYNYYFSKSLFRSGKRFHYRKALELESPVQFALNQNLNINKNYSNSNLTPLSVTTIQQHRLLNIWSFERYQFQDLLYSKVDEEVQRIKEKENLQFLGFAINSMQSKSILGIPKHTIISHFTVFDLSQDGIVYSSHFSSGIGAKSLMFNQLFYLRAVNNGL